MPVEVRHHISLHVVHGSSLFGLVDGECFQWLQIVVKLCQDDRVVACDQGTRRVAIILEATRQKDIYITSDEDSPFTIKKKNRIVTDANVLLTFMSGFSFFRTFLMVLFRTPDCAAKDETRQ